MYPGNHYSSGGGAFPGDASNQPQQSHGSITEGSRIPQMMVMGSPGGPNQGPMMKVVWNQDQDLTFNPGAGQGSTDPYGPPSFGDMRMDAAAMREREIARRRLLASPTDSGPGVRTARVSGTGGPGGMSEPVTNPLTFMPPAAQGLRLGAYDSPPPISGFGSVYSSPAVDMNNPAYNRGMPGMLPHDQIHEVDVLTGFPDGPAESDLGTEDEEDEDEDKPLVKPRKGPLVHRWNIWPLFLMFWFLGSAGFYFYVRVDELNGSYGMVILIVEFLGVTSFLPYAILLTRGIYPSGSTGLPVAGTEEAAAMAPPPKTPYPGRFLGSPGPASPGMGGGYQTYSADPHALQTPGRAMWSPGYDGYMGSRMMHSPGMGPSPFGPDGNMIEEEPYRFHVRVLVPCYKEPLEVVSATLNAARGAHLPAYTRRTVYLCDDGKDPQKKALVDSMGPDVVYVTGRKRKVNEINGKSANLNNCLKNVIYVDWPRDDDGEIDWAEISNKELIIVFDADMCAKAELYCRLLEVMMNEEYALVLSPQSFHNISRDADLFNNINKQFWECWLPGAFAWGYIACTGTNFCIRARALAHCGWFPDYTITEDYALGMELKSRGYKATYLMLYLAEGEAPEEIRNVFRQRSRWTKGHFQVFFSNKNPLLNMGLPFFQRLWYSYAAWAPLCTVLTMPAFVLVPFMSIFFGYNPVTITFRFVLSSTIYFTSLTLIQNYSYAWGDWKLMWFATGSNVVLWFTYCKAFFNSMLAKMGMKVMAFKVTEKVKPQADGAAPKQTGALVRAMSRVMSTVAGRGRNSQSGQSNMGSPGRPLISRPGSPGPGHHMMGSPYGRTPAKKGLSAMAAGNRVLFSTPGQGSSVPITPRKDSLMTREQLHTEKKGQVGTEKKGPAAVNAPLGSSSYVRGADPLPATEAGARGGWDRLKAVLESFKPANIREFDEMFDPLALFVLFVLSAVTFAFGCWQVSKSINQRAPASFDLNSPLKGSPYLIISTIWAFFNCVSPYLFLHYCITAGSTFKMAARLLMALSHMVVCMSIILVWLLIPTDFDVTGPLRLQIRNYYPNQIAADFNSRFEFVIGINATTVTPDFDTAYLSAMAASLAAAGSTAYSSRIRARELLGGVLRGEDTLSDWDPAALTDDDLAAPGPVAAWQRGLLQAGRATNQLIPDLSGGLLVKDHVKYGQPIAYTITQLAWSLIQFPDGFQDNKNNATKTVIRAGAEYLMRCLLKLRDGKYVYVAQVGDPRDYLVVENSASDPGTSGMSWTSPGLDPYLNGNATRKVWLMSEDAVGSDLLGNVAAALAAASHVLKAESPSFSALALNTALRVYTFASMVPLGKTPQSFCRFVPCTTNVTVKQQQLTVPMSKVPSLSDLNTPQCYYVDWLSSTCKMLYTVADCTAQTLKQREVYKTKMGCCNKLSSTGVWNTLFTRAQGICAVPDWQYKCYSPDASQRTCYEQSIDPRTGAGCGGKGVEIFATPLACCSYLVNKNIISAELGKAGSGICARINFDPNFQQCYVPSVSSATCIIKTGMECSSFGVESSYSEPTACCNRLVQMFQDLGFNKQGGIQFAPQGICTLSYNSNTGPITRRSLQQADDSAMLWTVPAPAMDTACLNNACDMRMVMKTVTVAHYNSTSTLDDMSWAGIWMYMASGDPRFLGEAQRYLDRHYKEDITTQTLNADRSYYVSDWNNLAWSCNVLLHSITGNDLYDQRIRVFLNTWVFGKSVPPVAGGLPPASTQVELSVINALSNFTDTATNTSYYVVPNCRATHPFENDCFDGIDNDCDGAIDSEDVDCGMFPVVYTKKDLAFARAPSLPIAASACWLGMVYADRQSGNTARRLRCWALGQVAYMIGATPDTRSFIVGFKNAPGIVQHRASSCPVPPPGSSLTDVPCNWDNAFWPTVPNPQSDLIAGALMHGPDIHDTFTEVRGNPQTLITMDGTAPLTGVLSGLTQTDTRLRSCELMHGVVQRLIGEQTL